MTQKMRRKNINHCFTCNKLKKYYFIPMTKNGFCSKCEEATTFSDKEEKKGVDVCLFSQLV